MFNISRALDGVKNIAREVGESVQRTVERTPAEARPETHARAAVQRAVPTDAQAETAISHLSRTVAANLTASGDYYDPKFSGEIADGDLKFLEIEGSLKSVEDLFGSKEGGPGFSADLVRAEAHFLRGDVTWKSPCFGDTYGFSPLGGCEFENTLTATGPAAHADAGLHDGSLEASLGGSLASLKAETSTEAPVVGDVKVEGEVGLKLEAGISLGKKTKVKLPFVSVGISFGG